jgi:hypothetical protein
MNDALDIYEIIKDEKYKDRFREFEPGRSRSHCRCPFHAGDNTPSFVVYSETNSFYCYGCKVGGGVVQLIQHLENTDKKTAQAIFNTYLTPEKIFDSKLKTTLNRTSQTNDDINTQFGEFCRKFAKKNPHLTDILDKKIYEFDQLIQQEDQPETFILQKKYMEISSYLFNYATNHKV